MSGYLENSALGDDIGDYVTLPGLGPLSGVLGGIGLARDRSA